MWFPGISTRRNAVKKPCFTTILLASALSLDICHSINRSMTCLCEECRINLRRWDVNSRLRSRLNFIASIVMMHIMFIYFYWLTFTFYTSRSFSKPHEHTHKKNETPAFIPKKSVERKKWTHDIFGFFVGVIFNFGLGRWRATNAPTELLWRMYHAHSRLQWKLESNIRLFHGLYYQTSLP